MNSCENRELKTKRNILLKGFFVLFFLSAAGFAQRIQNFNVFAVDKAVGIKFTISTGSPCNGYTIWHSLDSMNYSPLYSYGGICGSSSAPQDFSYTHNSPSPNAVNYYKVELTNIETSPVRRVYVGENSVITMLLFPNPIVYYSDVLNVKIFNATNLRLVGFIFNQYGKPMRQVDITTKVDAANLYINDLSNGLYVIWLTDGTMVYSSKFIINR
jgi:hypothetical protein